MDAPDATPGALFSLNGRTALVTGASGGLGLHFARVLHAAGATVVLAARRSDRIESEAARLGERAHAVPMDVADESSVRDAFDRVAAMLPPCDVIVNNAGISGSHLALQTEAAEWDGVIDVNLRGPFLVAREAARRLVAAGVPGSIVNVASILGIGVAPGVASYMASKAALIHLTRAMAYEFARHRIRVNALAPGYFKTDMNAAFLESDAGRATLKRVPQRRVGELRDLDGPLLLLASDAGAFMTGSVLVVDGGHAVTSL